MEPRQRIPPTAADAAAAGQEVIQQQADSLLPRRHAGVGVERQDEAQRPDQVRGVAEKPAPLVQRLVDEEEVAVFEVA